MKRLVVRTLIYISNTYSAKGLRLSKISPIALLISVYDFYGVYLLMIHLCCMYINMIKHSNTCDTYIYDYIIQILK